MDLHQKTMSSSLFLRDLAPDDASIMSTGSAIASSAPSSHNIASGSGGKSGKGRAKFGMFGFRESRILDTHPQHIDNIQASNLRKAQF